jgi:hypothetical protein
MGGGLRSPQSLLEWVGAHLWLGGGEQTSGEQLCCQFHHRGARGGGWWSSRSRKRRERLGCRDFVGNFITGCAKRSWQTTNATRGEGDGGGAVLSSRTGCQGTL